MGRKIRKRMKTEEEKEKEEEEKEEKDEEEKDNIYLTIPSLSSSYSSGKSEYSLVEP